MAEPTAMELTLLLADDEPIARRGLERALRAQPGVRDVIVCSNGIEALDQIRTRRPDAAFLDVAMPGMKGIDVARALTPRERPPIVFVTAFDRFAVEAFDLHAVDYLLKPFDPPRVRRAMDRVRERIVDGARRSGSFESLLENWDKRAPSTDRLVIRHNDGVVLVRFDDIDWFEAEDNYVRVHTEGRRYLTRLTMRALEDQLKGRDFARIHRGAIVNMAKVKELRAKFHGAYEVILADGTRLRLSRGFRDSVLGRRPSG
jgi:two-component system, LytTR family, response regulator